MARGVKRCPECGSDIHASSRFCYCGYEYYKVRTTKVKGTPVDWKELQKGDTIRIYSSDYFDGKDGQAIKVGHNGIFTVMEVNEQGILLHTSRGYSFQSMTNTDSNVGFHRSIPTIVKVNQPCRNRKQK